MNNFIPLIRTEWRLLLFSLFMMAGSSLGQTYFIALFGGEIRADLDLSHGEFGALYSLATLCSAVALLWSGNLLDRLDLRRFAYMTIAGLSLGCLLMAISQNAFMLLMALFLLRQMGQGLMFMAGPTSLVRYLERDKGKANALGAIGFSLSEAIFPSAVIAGLMWLSWRQSWLLWGGLLALLMPLMVYYLLRNHDQRQQNYLKRLQQAQTSSSTNINDSSASQSIAQHQWTRAEVLRDPLFYLFTPALMAQPFLFTGFMFHQVHLVEAKAWSLSYWGSLYIMYALTAIAFKLGFGVLVDRFGAIRLVPFLSVPMGVGLLILASGSGQWIAAILMLCMGVTVGAYSVVTAPFFSEKYGNLHLGAIKSLATSLMVFMSALSPVLFGWLLDRGVSINQLAIGGVIYIAIATLLAIYACRLNKTQMQLTPRPTAS